MYVDPTDTDTLATAAARQAARIAISKIPGTAILGGRTKYAPSAALDVVVIVVAAYDGCGGVEIARIRDHARYLLGVMGNDAVQAACHGVSRAMSQGLIRAVGVGQSGVTYRLHRTPSTQAIIDAATATILALQLGEDEDGKVAA